MKIRQAILNGSLSDLPVPLYHRLSWLLKEQILKAYWAAGDRLPTEIKLAEQYQVSRLTVRRAKALLEDEGLILTVQGSGSRVADSLRWKLKKKALSNLDDLIQIGQETSFDLQEFYMTANTPAVAEHLRNTDDRFIFKINGVRYLHNKPLCYATYYLAYAFGSRIQVDRLTEKPFRPQFEKMLNCNIIEGRLSIYPTRASSKIAEELQISRGALVLSVDTIYFNEAYTPVYLVQSRYGPGHKYEITLKSAATP